MKDQLLKETTIEEYKSDFFTGIVMLMRKLFMI
ncbi:hypothetical protein SAMN05192545_0284 [Maribacter dokdonensis]|uniref:Uncharacterized protein n=1 Tax=Maribacter dokdonensis TaxID=320912 RepID=A0A1H4JKH2_9FLAO|nr:hypothetical protein SAMN05192545_0284 [Maribacter dokdonensis]SEB46455.1 hypothetical protein SAMN05192540_0412 [Maribacter dokdonensis]